MFVSTQPYPTFGLGQHRGTTAHIAGRHEVGNVDEPDPGGDTGGDPVAGRDEPVLQAVVGKKRYAVERSHEG